MPETVHVRDAELLRALEEGADYLVAGQRRFLLVEVDESEQEAFEVTDPEEIESLRRALDNTRPLLSGDEARAYVKARLKEHGIR